MHAKDTSVPARYYAHFCELMAQSGMDVPRILKTAGIDPEIIQSPATMLQLHQVEQLVETSMQQSGRSDLAHDLGKSLKLSSHGTLGFAFLSSPTLDYALRLAAQYFRLILPIFAVRYRPGPKGAEIIVSPTASLSHRCLKFHIELIAVAFHWEVRDLLQDRMPAYDLYLSIPEPPHRARYRELAEARCHFGWEERPGFRLLLPGEVIHRPLKLADPWSLKQAEQRCKELVNKALARGRITEWIEMMLREASGGTPKLSELAQTLNLSPRTLDRYLKREGASFRDLSRKALYEKACSLLAFSEMSVTQIAYELGYTDVSNFARAFRREAGLSPYRWREERQQAPSDRESPVESAKAV